MQNLRLVDINTPPLGSIIAYKIAIFKKLRVKQSAGLFLLDDVTCSKLCSNAALTNKTPL
jgi:hypothetical protein